MARSPLLGRRIHIAGSIVEDVALATADDVKRSREFVGALVKEWYDTAPISSCPWTPSPSERRIACRSVSTGSSGRPFGTTSCTGPPAPLGRWRSRSSTTKARTRSRRSSSSCGTTCAEISLLSRSRTQPTGTWPVSAWRPRRDPATYLWPWGEGKECFSSANLYHGAGKPIVPSTCPSAPKTRAPDGFIIPDLPATRHDGCSRSRATATLITG